MTFGLEGLLIQIIMGIPPLLGVLDFMIYLKTKKRFGGKTLTRLLDLCLVVFLPLLYLVSSGYENNCCGDSSAVFSPDHRWSIYILIVLCIGAYFYSSYKKSVKSPVLEVTVNAFLMAGIILNILIVVQIHHDPTRIFGLPIWLFGNVPIILLFILQLLNNHKQFLEYSQNIAIETTGKYEKWAWRILKLNPIFKMPIFAVLCLPLWTILSGILLLFGQKPDALIRAFTDTYRRGFSQLDYLCRNVECGGHYLCSVAVNGHKSLVRPARTGVRGGRAIWCNRQLLVANAFEELVEQKLPNIHKMIRENYDKVGEIVLRHYGIFNNKWFCDLTYVFMKPLEWVFLLTLYTLDAKPENRIALQYLKPMDRRLIEEQLHALK